MRPRISAFLCWKEKGLKERMRETEAAFLRPEFLSKMRMWGMEVAHPQGFLSLEAKAKGMERPTMKRKAGKTRSTKVMPSWMRGRMSEACCIQEGTCADSGAPARSLTKIMVSMTMPRRA